jgi:phage-related tail fiber protein
MLPPNTEAVTLLPFSPALVFATIKWVENLIDDEPMLTARIPSVEVDRSPNAESLKASLHCQKRKRSSC